MAEHIRPMSDSEFDILNIDHGVRETVRLLRRYGFKTCDSGDGFSKENDARDLEHAHVFCVVTAENFKSEADRLASLLPDWQVEASYRPEDGKFILSAIDVRF